MSEPIKVGDLVVVVHWPCCKYGLGKVYMVEGFKEAPATHCDSCRTKPGKQILAVGKSHQVPPSWLRRIPPLWELDEAEHKEELTA